MSIGYRDTLAMGFSERHSGTKMLRYAANYAANQHTLSSGAWQMMVTKNVYPQVARAFGSTPGRVERNIRAAVAAAGHSVPNSEMIARLTELALEKGASGDEG